MSRITHVIAVLFNQSMQLGRLHTMGPPFRYGVHMADTSETRYICMVVDTDVQYMAGEWTYAGAL